MKRILVIDDSEMVRETLALILGREFVVQKRALGSAEGFFAGTEQDVDLVILGVTPATGSQALRLLRLASSFPFALLLLVDSKTTARSIDVPETIECLAKPFNPYELREKVARLLARDRPIEVEVGPESGRQPDLSPYLEFPFLTRAAATLVPRFAKSNLPVLVSGEIGCGQDRVARAIAAALGSHALVSLQAADASPDYLAQKELELRRRSGRWEAAVVLVIENLDAISPRAQPELLAFLDEQQRRGRALRLLSTARADLLQKVYAGEFMEGLYYKLATLTLHLPPLRERSADVPPAIAARLAGHYGELLGLGGNVSISAEANQRLSNYLWFGNLRELETVIARTLAVHRKSRIEASELIFDFAPDLPVPELPPDGLLEEPPGTAETHPTNGLQPPGIANGNRAAPELKALIHELAHELKNPMVTIKTFAQLLSDRYDDVDFRTRFQEIVGGDIERMDELLEAMIEFAEFPPPQARRVSLEERVRAAVEDLKGRCEERQTRFTWRGAGRAHEVLGDDVQLKYAIKNVLAAALAQAKPGAEIEIDLERTGSAVISYLRETPRVGAVTQYFGAGAQETSPATMPLRVLLAKHLIERNGGRLDSDASEAEKDVLKLEFTV